MLNGLISHRTIGLIVGPIDVLAIVDSTITGGVRYHPSGSDDVSSLTNFMAVGADPAALFELFSCQPVGYTTTSDSSPIGQAGSCGSVGLGGVALAFIFLLFLLKISGEYSRGRLCPSSLYQAWNTGRARRNG
jgi:hypothetical protein